MQRLREVAEPLRLCEVCAQPHVFPMAQCQNGHIYCRACLARAGLCPACRVEVPAPPVRCLLADAVAEAMDFPMRCRWGCGHSSLTPAREAHEAHCGRRPVPCAGCARQMPAADLLRHCVQEHGVAHSAGPHRMEPPRGAGQMASVVLLRAAPDGPAGDGPPPAAVVHLQRADDGSDAHWLWAQAAGSASDWEATARVEGPGVSAACTFPLQPLVRAGAVVPAGEARGKAPRLDLSGFPEGARVEVALRRGDR